MKKFVKIVFSWVHVLLSQLFLVNKIFIEAPRFVYLRIKVGDKFLRDLSQIDRKFIDKTWIDFHDRIVFETKSPNYFFFNEKSLIETMTSNSFTANYIPFLNKAREHLSNKEIKLLLKENSVGGPRLLLNSFFNKRFSRTSITRAVHIYQLAQSKKLLNSFPMSEELFVVEWGGGYGGLCNVFNKFYLDKNLTYVIIDIPVAIHLQYYYLSTIYGKNFVNVVDVNNKITRNKINLVGLSILENVDLKCDLFVSSWAISESNLHSQNFVINKNFFNADAILLLHQESSEVHPYADYISRHVVLNYNVVVKEIVPVWSNQHLILAKNFPKK